MKRIQGDLKAVLKGLKDLTKKAEYIGKRIAKKLEQLEKPPKKKAASKPKAVKKVELKAKPVKKEAKKSVTRRKPAEKVARKTAVKPKRVTNAPRKAVKREKPVAQPVAQPIEKASGESVAETVFVVSGAGSVPVESPVLMEQPGSPNQEVTEKRTKLRKKRPVEAQEKGEGVP